MKIIWSKFNYNEITAIRNALDDTKSEIINKTENLQNQISQYIYIGDFIIGIILICLICLTKKLELVLSLPVIALFTFTIITHIDLDGEKSLIDKILCKIPIIQYKKIINQVNITAIREIEKIQKTTDLIAASIDIKEHISDRPKKHLYIIEKNVNNKEICDLTFIADGYSETDDDVFLKRNRYERIITLKNHDEISIIEHNIVNFAKLDEYLLNDMHTLKDIMTDIPSDNNLLRLEEKTDFLNDNILNVTEEYVEIEQ